MGRTTRNLLRALVAGLALAATVVAVGAAFGRGGTEGTFSSVSVTKSGGAAQGVADRAAAGSSSRRAVVWAVGDGADGGSAGRSVGAMIEAAAPDRLIYLGDVYDDGTWQEYQDNYVPAFGGLRDITLPTPGNHEWGNREVGYRRYWAGAGVTGPPDDVYAKRLAGWTLLSLNSEAPHERGSEQWRWLRRQVAGGGDCRIAFWHRPRHSAGSHGSERDMAPIWRLLARRARLVLNGHEHNMQRLRRSKGITTLISGAGGQGHYPVDSSFPRLAFADDENYGALRLALRPGRVRWRFVSVGGQVLDSGGGRCGPSRRAAAAG